MNGDTRAVLESESLRTSEALVSYEALGPLTAAETGPYTAAVHEARRFGGSATAYAAAQ